MDVDDDLEDFLDADADIDGEVEVSLSENEEETTEKEKKKEKQEEKKQEKQEDEEDEEDYETCDDDDDGAEDDAEIAEWMKMKNEEENRPLCLWCHVTEVHKIRATGTLSRLCLQCDTKRKRDMNKKKRAEAMKALSPKKNIGKIKIKKPIPVKLKNKIYSLPPPLVMKYTSIIQKYVQGLITEKQFFTQFDFKH